MFEDTWKPLIPGAPCSPRSPAGPFGNAPYLKQICNFGSSMTNIQDMCTFQLH